MASASRIVSYVNNITLCPICLEDYVDPRSLPCLHTFCLRCIERHCQGKLPRDEVECPVCRNEFEIPGKGCVGLAHNFFVDGLVIVRRTEMSNQPTAKVKGPGVDQPCEGCEDGDTKAIMYCLDCRERLCMRCGKRCEIRKAGAHKVVKLGEELNQENLRYRGSYCEIHKGEMFKLFCSQCKVNVCTLCVATEHHGHKCLDIKEVASEFEKQIKPMMDGLKTKIHEIRQKCKVADDSHESLSRKIENSERLMKQAAIEIKEQVDRELDELLQELVSTKARAVKELHSRRENIDMSLIALESFVSYCSELIGKGAPHDVTRSANELIARANELKRVGVTKESNDYVIPEILFKRTNLIQILKASNTNADVRGRLLGSLSVSWPSQPTVKPRPAPRQTPPSQPTATRSALELEKHSEVKHRQATPDKTDVYHGRPQLVNQLATKSAVRGVTQMDDKIFVVCSDTIQVFGQNSEQLEDIKVKGLKEPWDIVACSETRSLYVADYGSAGCVWRVSVDGRVDKFLPTTTSSSFSPESLSVLSGRLLVTSRGAVLLLYGADGVELKRLSFTDMSDLWHAVETSRGTFVFCHTKPQRQVVEVDGDGRIISVYKDQQQLSLPRHLSIDSEGKMLIADYHKHHILLLTRDLQLDRVLLDTEHNRLVRGPCRLFYVQQTRQLIVGSGWSRVAQVFAVG